MANLQHDVPEGKVAANSGKTKSRHARVVQKPQEQVSDWCVCVCVWCGHKHVLMVLPCHPRPHLWSHKCDIHVEMTNTALRAAIACIVQTLNCHRPSE